MIKIHEEDQYNDCYGRERMYLALQQRKDAGKTDIYIPCEATVRKVMVQIGLIHKPRRKPNGITNPEYSISCGIQYLKSVLTAAGVQNPVDMDRIKAHANDFDGLMAYRSENDLPPVSIVNDYSELEKKIGHLEKSQQIGFAKLAKAIRENNYQQFSKSI